jgi:hypothetical protein
MGTNVYWVEGDRRLHVGKFSVGWVFAMQVLPEEGLQSLEDWKERIEAGGRLENEYREGVPLSEFLAQVTERSWDRRWNNRPWLGYKNEREFHACNHSERGPNNLLRSKIDGKRCIGHGPMWDLIAGDFS